MKLRSHSLGVQPTPTYRNGDAVGAYEPSDPSTITYGRIEGIGFTEAEGFSIRTADGELTGPWFVGKDTIFFDVTAHVDYPHHPGTLHDCPGCEALMAKEEEGFCPGCGAEVALDCTCEESAS